MSGLYPDRRHQRQGTDRTESRRRTRSTADASTAHPGATTAQGEQKDPTRQNRTQVPDSNTPRGHHRPGGTGKGPTCLHRTQAYRHRTATDSHTARAHQPTKGTSQTSREAHAGQSPQKTARTTQSPETEGSQVSQAERQAMQSLHGGAWAGVRQVHASPADQLPGDAALGPPNPEGCHNSQTTGQDTPLQQG